MNVATSKSYEAKVEAADGLERRMTIRVPTVDIEREIDARLVKVGRDGEIEGLSAGQGAAEGRAPVLRRPGARGGAERRRSHHLFARDRRPEPESGRRSAYRAAGRGGRRRAEHFSYRATFEVYPEITLQPLEQLSLEVPAVEIGDADVDAMIEKLRAQRVTWHAVERAAAERDRVVVDFVGKIDGEPFQGGEGKDVTIVVGGGQVLAEFDQALRGVAAGGKTTAAVNVPGRLSGRESGRQARRRSTSPCSASRSSSCRSSTTRSPASFG